MTKRRTRANRSAENAQDRLPLAPPGGMRDLLPPASMARAVLRQRVMETFALHGYQRVTTPPFEYAEVLERGLENVDRRDVVRFVEPDTGEVALLRPDITPQVARIVATRMQSRPGPWRLCYEGTVIRRRRGRARLHQQIFQSGVECVGIKGADGDAEVIEIAARTCEAVGLTKYAIELAQVNVGRHALQEVPDDAREAVIDALLRKDGRLLQRRLRSAGVPARGQKELLTLVDLYGDASVIRDARKKLRAKAVSNSLDELERVLDRLVSAGLGPIGIDLGELRGQSYYTGVSVTLLADGPGEPVGQGGRYDQLLGRYGDAAPATGFAFDIDNLEWALTKAGANLHAEVPPRALVAGGSPARRRNVSEILRAAGVRAAASSDKDAKTVRQFAKAWEYDLLLRLEGKGAKVTRLRDGRSRTVSLDAGAISELKTWVLPASE